MSRPGIRTGASGVVLILVGILLSLLGDPSITLFALGLAVVGLGTVVLTLLFFSALGHVEHSDELPDPESWRRLPAPGSGIWLYPPAEEAGGGPDRVGEREMAARPDRVGEREMAVRPDRVD